MGRFAEENDAESPSSIVHDRLRSLRSFTGEAGRAFLAQVCVAVLGASTLLLTARGLGPGGQGEASTVLAVAVLLGVTVGGSVLPSVVHLSAQGVPEAQLRGGALVVGLITGFGLGMVLLLLGSSKVARNLLGAVDAETVFAGALVAGLAPVDRATNGLLRARGLVRANAVIDVVESVVVLFAVGVLVGVNALTPATAVLAYGLGILFSGAAAGLRAGVQHIRRSDVRRSVVGEIARFGRPVWMGYLVQYGLYRLDLILLSSITGPAAAGSYAVAARLSETITLVPSAAGQVVSPRSAHLNRRELAASTPRIFWAVAALSAGLAAVAAVAAGWLIAFLFGNEYQGVVAETRVLLVALVVVAPSRVLSEELVQIGEPGYALRNSVVAFAVGCVAWLVLIPSHGIMGAAVGSLIAYSANAAATITTYVATMPLTPKQFLRSAWFWTAGERFASP